MAAYQVLLLNTAIPQIQAAQAGDTYVVPRDIAFSAALTLDAGTANGVPYLNGSKVVTTGSALTFDGTNSFLGIGPGVSPTKSLTIYNPSIDTEIRLQAGAKNFYLSQRNSSGQVDYIVVDNAAQSWSVDNTEQMRLTSTGLELKTGNLIIGASGKGIDFSATAGPTNGTMTSELLSDYEEGTWTPGFGTGWTTAPSVATTATYVKIGKQVTVSVYLLDGVSTAGALITGLPFTVGIESSMTGFSGSTSTAPLMTGVTQGGTTQIRSIPAATMTGLYWTVSTTYFV